MPRKNNSETKLFTGVNQASYPEMSRRAFLLGLPALALILDHAVRRQSVHSQEIPTPTPPAPLVSSETPVSVSETGTPAPEYLFEEHPSVDFEFSAFPDGPFTDRTFLVPEVGSFNGTEELNTQSSNNVFVQDGVLHLVPRKEKATYKGKDYQYTSARLSTKGKFDFDYGKIEIEVQMGGGTGTNSGVWFQSTDQSNSKDPALNVGVDPKLQFLDNGEIDFEHLGTRKKLNVTGWSLNAKLAGNNPNGKEIAANDLDTAFHTFGLEKTPDAIKFFYDGELIHELNRDLTVPINIKDWPYNHTFHLMFTDALGGAWPVSDAKQRGVLDQFPTGVDDSTEAQWSMKIKSIKFRKMLAPAA